MKKGRAGTMTHDYKRNGTNDAVCCSRRARRWLQWLDRHPTLRLHFTPTSCSWLNAVEGFFAKLAKQRLKARAGSYGASLNSRPPSTASLRRPTTIQNPSSGLQTQIKSSPLSGGGTKC